MNIAVVLVTYNRLAKLKKALKSYEDQTVKPAYIIVVNNNSTDGTKEYLKTWESNAGIKKRVINLKKNIGGSGGFHEGLKESLSLDAEWIWVADDDAYPKSNAFEIAQEYLEKHKDDIKDLSAICGTIYRSDSTTIDRSHRRRIYTTFPSRIAQLYSRPSDYEKEEFEVNSFSYVGTLINKEKLKQTELPQRDYFIYYDDTEHSYRLARLGKIVCIPKMQIIHDAPHSQMNEIVKWKLYYLIRNTLNFVHANFDEKYFKEQCVEVPLKFKIAVLFFGKNKVSGFKMIDEAVKDAKAGKTGLHDVFKPGWSPER